jgi:uncharacterized protein (TIGR02246 family)
MLRVTLVVLSAAVLTTGGIRAGHAAEADVVREAQDRAEIQELMWRYVQALDTLDPEAYASVFTEDGQFGAGANAQKGRAALTQMVQGLKDARAEREADGEPPSAQMYHVITNSHIEFVDADHARYHSYWMTVFGAAGEGTTPRVAAAGQGIDDLVRVDGQWLIRTRNVAVRN